MRHGARRVTDEISFRDQTRRGQMGIGRTNQAEGKGIHVELARENEPLCQGFPDEGHWRNPGTRKERRRLLPELREGQFLVAAEFVLSRDATFANCTITNNSAEQKGGGFRGFGKLINCIVWGNEAVQGSQIAVAFGILEVDYSDVEGGVSEVEVFVGEGTNLDWGEGNIDLDPLFVDPDSGDFRLLTGSPSHRRSRYHCHPR